MNWHKRHALSLASQLPENASDANAVIRELQDLVDILGVEEEKAREIYEAVHREPVTS